MEYLFSILLNFRASCVRVIHICPSPMLLNLLRSGFGNPTNRAGVFSLPGGSRWAESCLRSIHVKIYWNINFIPYHSAGQSWFMLS